MNETPSSLPAKLATTRPAPIERGETSTAWLIGTSLGLLIVAGAFLRWRLLDRPLWDDELWQRFVVAKASWSDLMRWRYDDRMHPAFSFILNRLCLDLLRSDAAWVWRLPSVICGVLCIPAAFLLGRRIDGPVLGLGVAALVAFDLNLTWESANARMYAMLALGTILVVAAASPVLSVRQTSVKNAVILSLPMAFVMWTHVLGVVVWGALAMAGAFLFVRARFHSAPPASWKPVVSHLAIAFALAGLLAFPGLYRLLTIREIHEADVPHRTLSEMVHLFYWVTNLLVWIEVRLASPLILALSVAGAALIYRRSAGMAALLLGLGLVTVVMQARVLQAHPFTATRYWIPAQPILWVGFSYLCLVAPARRLRPFTFVAFAVFAGFQFWNCTRLETTYGTVAADVSESRVFVEAVNFVRSNRSSADAVTYIPYERFAYRGEYFGLPATAALGGEPAPSIPRLPMDRNAGLNAPATWILAKINKDPAAAAKDRELPGVLAELAGFYHTPLDMAPPTASAGGDCWLVMRVDHDGLRPTIFAVK